MKRLYAMNNNYFKKQKETVQRVGIACISANLINRRHQGLLQSFLGKAPEENLASHRTAIWIIFGKLLILHQNSSSSSFLKVSYKVESETL